MSGEHHATSGFAARFLVFYVLLGAVLAAAVTGLVLVATQPGAPKPPIWSTWKPKGGNTENVTQQIADHVAGQYKLSKGGDQLVAIVPGKPEVTKDTRVSPIAKIGFLSSPTATQCCSRIVTTGHTIQAQFCGLGSRCSISLGTPTAARERLLRREALELALYTFKYAPSVNAVIAYMPPPPGQSPSTLLYLERSNLSHQLTQPLSATLPLSTPPLPSQPDPKEKDAIDKLTLPVEYGFQYESLTSDTSAIVLTPSSY